MSKRMRSALFGNRGVKMEKARHCLTFCRSAARLYRRGPKFAVTGASTSVVTGRLNFVFQAAFN